ncbi:toxin-antitoxin system TumE family protein [Brevibacillus dissolubilis]|uniref:toxin-antitoxin system TumE family protein n=1 Tax=Brevibacillus dissolubilis TaxID=1844116 RepID=UPI0011168E80|nr:DUF6516 family protein [Brevibacillus dissolubilis]
MSRNGSNFRLIKEVFRDLILETEDVLEQSGFVQKVFIFSDFSRLYVTEEWRSREGRLLFWYDWEDRNKQVIYKFHSESHDLPHLQTDTEPFHIHTPDGIRLPNYAFRDLFSVLNFIQLVLRQQERDKMLK